MILDDYVLQTKRLVQSGYGSGPAELQDVDFEAFVNEAVVEHSRFAPQFVTAMLSGTGATQEFRLDDQSVPFVYNVSTIRGVEYPTGNNPPSLVDRNEYVVVRNSLGQTVLLFLVSTPAAGTNNIRADYTAPQTLTQSGSSIPDYDFYAVCHLAASIAFDVLAAQASHEVDDSIAADARGWRYGSDVYATRAKDHRDQYYRHFGIDPDAAGGSSGSISASTVSRNRDWDSLNTAGFEFMFHTRRRT